MPTTVWERGLTFRSGKGYGRVYDNAGNSIVVTRVGRTQYTIQIKPVPPDARREEDLRIPHDIQMAFDAVHLITSDMSLLMRDTGLTSEVFIMSR